MAVRNRKRRAVFKVPRFPLGKVLERRGVSQRELARLSGISQPLVNAYVAGHVTPTWPAIWQMVAALGCHLGDFDPHLVDEDLTHASN